ncbi:MAG: DUF4129 domain-containing protein [Beutenbergiaceae bacterium]
MRFSLDAPFEPPLTPSDDEARDWAISELSKAIYDDDPTWLDAFRSWLQDLWNTLFNQSAGAGAILAPLLVLLIVALVIGLAFLLGGPLRRRRLGSSVTDSTAVLDDDDRSAELLRAAADAAAAAGDFGTAVLERFRAIVRALDERAVLEDRRGRTAHEAAAAAGARLAPCAEDLMQASRLFDEVCYGEFQPGATEHDWLIALDRAVAKTKPSRTGDLRAADVVAPR